MTKDIIETGQIYVQWLYDTRRLRRRPLKYIDKDGNTKTRPPLKKYETVLY